MCSHKMQPWFFIYLFIAILILGTEYALTEYCMLFRQNEDGEDVGFLATTWLGFRFVVRNNEMVKLPDRIKKKSA